MQENTSPFTGFQTGSHLILGEPGSGKTKLIWSVLQTSAFSDDSAINIVLTDTSQRMWYENTMNPIRVLDSSNPDISWITQPSEPGIYYCPCDYAPRVITFLECLATWAVHNQNETSQKVRLFLDFSTKCWTRAEFVEQLTRLHYISTNQVNIEIWAIIGAYKKVSLLARTLFDKTNLILVNPFPANLMAEICETLGLNRSSLPGLEFINFERPTGFYYIPYNEQAAYWHS
jgi:hypothetical protein